MNTLFENPTISLDSLPAVEEISWIQIELRYRKLALLRNLFLSFLLIPIGFGLWLLYMLLGESSIAGSLRLLLGAFGTVLILLLLFQWFAMPFLAVPRMKYAVRHEDINYRHGVFSTHTTSAPFRRMQHAETNRGPLERMFDLASVSVFTAAGQALQIRGLSPETAEKLRDHVLKKISEYKQLDTTGTANSSDEQ